MRNGVLATGLLLFGAAYTTGCQPDDTFRRVRAALEVEPERLEFGEALIGAPVALAVSMKNAGDAILSVCTAGSSSSECSDATRVLPDSAPVRLDGLSSDKTWDVPSGATRQLIVTFTPSDTSPFTAELLVAHNGSNGPTATIPITGIGVVPNVSVSAETLDFGELAVGARKDLTLTLTNHTSFRQPVELVVGEQASIMFGIATVAGVDAPFGETLKVDIPGNGAIDVKAWYRPIEEGSHQNTLEVRYCPDCTKTVTLIGRGTKPVFALVPGQLDFGNLPDGQSGTRSFVVRNIGSSALNVISVERDAQTSTEFMIVPAAALPQTLAGGQELRVDVTYLGVTTGADFGRIEVVTDGWDDPTTPAQERNGAVAVSAVSLGPDVNAIPAQLNFGAVAVGSESTMNLVLENTGNAALQIQSIVLEQASQEISIPSPPQVPRSVDPGGVFTVTLRYSPADPGMDSNTVIVRSNDRDEGMLAIPVQGLGALPNACVLSIAPNPLNFGLVARGRTVRLPVTIENVGAQPCNLSNIRIGGAAEMTIVSGAAAALTLQTGQNQVVEIAYAPQVYASHNAQLQFESNDPTAPNVSVTVSGTSAPTDLLVVPPAVDFGVVPVMCRSPNRTVTMYNTGANNIRISDVRFDPSTSPEMELTPYLTPSTIPAGGSSTINLRYRPAAIGRDNGVLFITSDASVVPVAVPLDGEGQINPVVTDTFQQAPTAADILFVIDNSCSMEEEQDGVGTNLAAFLSFAMGNGLDYQIAVTTTDVDAGGEQGRFVGSTRVITPQTANASSVFQTNVSQGINGATAEQGLEAAYLALSDPQINTWNAGFMRPDAGLAVIIVSDEEDQSSRPRTFYESFFRSLKGPGNESRVTVSGVVGTTNPECNSPNGIGDYAPRYIQTAQNTGGIVESICSSNWAQALSNIGFTAFGLRRRFPLSSNAVASSIQVSVDRTNVPAVTASGFQNWSYDAASNSVSFTQGAEPVAYANVSITYSVSCLP